MRRTLSALVVAAISITAATEAVAAPYASRTLKVGTSGSDVRALQRYLDGAGFETVADGQFGPATQRSVLGFEAHEGRRANGRASRADQRLVRRRAADANEETTAESPAEAPVDEAFLDEEGMAVAPVSAPEEVKEIIEAGNEIATKPYKYGGGHGRWVDSGYDCSGSVSYVLHAAGLLGTPLDSNGLMRWGKRGRGDWVTVRSNPSHAYLIVAGLRFDTSARKQTGNRWSEQMRSASGYRARRPEGL